MMPPSTARFCRVIHRAPGPTRKTIASAMSSGCPKRCSGVISIKARRASDASLSMLYGLRHRICDFVKNSSLSSERWGRSAEKCPIRSGRTYSDQKRSGRRRERTVGGKIDGTGGETEEYLPVRQSSVAVMTSAVVRTRSTASRLEAVRNLGAR